MISELSARFVSEAKTLAHEVTAHEERAWVRLTRVCNNRCVFCLDTASQDGTRVSDAEIEAAIRRGRQRGATRLILSGGEPTVHPRFIAFVALGRSVGYGHVQTITNGRMFSYRDFLQKSVAAGLREITFSMHGHTAALHDELVGVPGAFDQAIAGLQAALACTLVSVDVCLNRLNITALPDILAHYIGLGVREFDLLHLIPFGRAYDERHRNDLWYDLDAARPYVQQALALSERPDLHIWFNRFPPPYLEGYEHLIQEPHKLLDEVRGRYEDFDTWLCYGEPLICREPSRCALCYLEPFCDNLEAERVRNRDGRFDAYRVDVDCGGAQAVRQLPTYPLVWVRAADASAAARAAVHLPGEQIILELARYDDLAGVVRDGRVGGKELVRAIAHEPAQLERLLATAGDFEIFAVLTDGVAEKLLTNPDPPSTRLVLGHASYARRSDQLAHAADLSHFFAAYSYALPVEGIPACVTGRAPRESLRVLDAAMLRAEGSESRQGENRIGDSVRATITLAPDAVADPAPLDVFGLAHRYIREGYRTKSLRCRECVLDGDCDGMHINDIRAHGYRILRAVTEERRRSYELDFPEHAEASMRKPGRVVRAAVIGLGGPDNEAALAPTRSVRANSFNYVHVRDFDHFVIRAGACSARDLCRDLDPDRDVLMQDGESVASFHSSTADFTPTDLRRVKLDLEQLYLDRTQTAALTEFPTGFEGMEHLCTHRECRGCHDRDVCCGAVEVASDQPFIREESWLRDEVSRLKGRVLDVGCGEQPYRDEIGALIVTGEIEYHGLDPDVVALDRLRQARLGGTLYAGPIETFEAEPGYFDHVLVLRSLNHFRDIERAFDVLSRVVRQEGQLLLCDSPVFGLLRRAEQVAYADANAPVGHEHFRNWTSHQVVQFIERFPLRVRLHRPVSPDTSNQWLLKLIRDPDPVELASSP